MVAIIENNLLNAGICDFELEIGREDQTTKVNLLIKLPVIDQDGHERKHKITVRYKNQFCSDRYGRTYVTNWVNKIVEEVQNVRGK